MPGALLEDTIISVSDARNDFAKMLNDVREGRPVTIHHGKDALVTLVRRDWLFDVLKVRDDLLNHLERVENLVHTMDVLEMSVDPDFVQMLRSRLERLTAAQGIPLSRAKDMLEG